MRKKSNSSIMSKALSNFDVDMKIQSKISSLAPNLYQSKPPNNKYIKPCNMKAAKSAQNLKFLPNKLVPNSKKIAAYNLGKNAENIAMKFLNNYTYSEIARRYKTKYGEIDLIAWSEIEQRLVFVEVKARNKIAFTNNTQAISNISEFSKNILNPPCNLQKQQKSLKKEDIATIS
jgi:Holliday junction resolvase-like predicted endonuclease